MRARNVLLWLPIMSDCRPLAVVRSYDDLHAALRARADALNVSRQTLDHISGLQSGYCSKLLAPVPIKAIGRASLAPLLGALGLKILIVVDDEMMAQISARLVERRAANESMLTSEIQRDYGEWRRRGNSAWGKMMRARSVLLSTEADRKKRARKAAKARWHKPKLVEIKPKRKS